MYETKVNIVQFKSFQPRHSRLCFSIEDAAIRWNLGKKFRVTKKIYTPDLANTPTTIYRFTGDKINYYTI